VGSRARVITTLFAVEVALFGMIVYFLGGAPTHAASTVDVGGNRIVDVLDAGNAPHVVVRDPDSRVFIVPSTDAKVHVTDLWSMHGWTFGSTKIPQLHVTRTADGIEVVRDPEHAAHFVMFGSSTERTQIALPADATLDVEKSSGDDITGIAGSMRIRSQDGRIYFHDVNSLSIDAYSGDGRIVFDGTLRPDGEYNLKTADGRIVVTATGLSGMGIHAQTGDGSIRIDGRRVGNRDDADDAAYDAAGNTAGKINVQTNDGSITINSMGASK